MAVPRTVKKKNFNTTQIGSHIAVAGTQISGGRFMEEYLGNLRFPTFAARTYDKMSRSDAQIQAMLNALTTPLLSARFEYIADESDPEQVKQAMYKNRFFKEHPIMPWTQTLGEILTFLKFGFSLFEPYGHVIDDPELGKIATLKSIGFIKQDTIHQWDVEAGEIKQVHQVCTQNGKMSNVWIKGENLIHFAHKMEGDNFEGVSILRPIYGNYIRKDLYLKIDMIGLEKMSVGTPIFFVPKQILSDEEEMANLASIGESYAAHEKAYMILDDRMKDTGFRIEKGEYNASAIADAIKREDSGIIESILAQFLTIGTQRAGGNAQNDGQMRLFLQSLTHLAAYITDKLDNFVHPWYVYNFGEPKTRLYMKAHGILMDDAKNTMDIITGYKNAGIIQADDKLEAKIRQDIKLPGVDTATIRVAPKQGALNEPA